MAMSSEDTNAVETTLGFTSLADVSESQILDASYLVVCGDMQRPVHPRRRQHPLNLCRTTTGDESYCSADWQNCPDRRSRRKPARQWFGDPGYRASTPRTWAAPTSRFADGHAKW
jgi:hypothetical protein